MTQSYRKLGMPDLANDAFRVLELNHPEHEKTTMLKQKK
jgi:outer membrane protein assembly factor BamD (BamD/ComL family)